MHKLLHEIRRRGVIPAVISYIVGAWVLVEIVDLVGDAFDLPSWLLQALVIVLAALVPVVVVFSWRYDITPDGIVRTTMADDDTAATRLFDRRLRFVTIGMLAGALALSIYANFRAPDAAPELVTILIADIENETGNALYSGVLEETLRVGLEVAPFVEMYPRASATAVASELAAEESTEALTTELAGLVALRESVDMVLGGTVSQSGGTLSIELSGFAPGAAEALFTVEEIAESPAEILDAIAEISRRLRRELGESPRSDDTGRNESFAVANLEAAAEYLEAQDLQRRRKLEEAVSHYREALRYDPEFARAYAGLALTQQYLGDRDAAAANWEEALSRLDSLTERGRLRTLGVYYTTFRRDYSRALDTFERLVASFPGDNVGQNNLAVAAFYTMDFARAMEVGQRVAARFPEHSGYGANLALYAMYASNFDEAAKVAATVLRLDPTNVYAHTVKALTLIVDGRYDDATETYDSMRTLDQFGQALAPEGLADLALYRGDFDAAVELLNAELGATEAATISHAQALKFTLLAEALLAAGRNDDAGQAARTAIAGASGDPAALVPAAFVLIELGDAQAASEVAAQLEASLSAAPQAYAAAIRAAIAAEAGQLQDAIESADQALAAEDLWFVRLIRADVYARSGDVVRAAQELEICQSRPGEAIAVFLNDRPSVRMLRRLEKVEGVIL